MKSYTQRQLFDEVGLSLNQFFTSGEANSLRRILLEHVLKIPYYQVHLNPNAQVSPSLTKEILDITGQLVQDVPIQYLLGETTFMELNLTVNPSVLIPRPETEELVRWVIADCHLPKPKILDIGTGSGCIAIALAKNIPDSALTAVDISPDALKVAGHNAKINSASICFVEADILSSNLIPNAPFDIVVSNPPYVRSSERRFMHKNVLDHEPPLALFVSDDNPLQFYEAIVSKSPKWIKQGGRLFLEINEAFGNQMAELLEANHFGGVTLRKDIHERYRMISGIFTG
jgi:release factor glutamine methyltransferase